MSEENLLGQNSDECLPTPKLNIEMSSIGWDNISTTAALVKLERQQKKKSQAVR